MALQVAQGPLNDRVRVYDFVKAELWQPFCRASGTIKNQGTGALTAGQITVGYPLVRISEGVWRTALQADQAAFHGFFIDEGLHEALASAATTVGKYQILERGPAIINQDRLPATDTDGAAFTRATLVATALALNPAIKTFKEPATSQIQST